MTAAALPADVLARGQWVMPGENDAALPIAGYAASKGRQAMDHNDLDMGQGEFAATPVAERERCCRRDFRTIYRITLLLCLLMIPLRRLFAVGARRRGRRPSMLAQARSEAGIVASCALMGY